MKKTPIIIIAAVVAVVAVIGIIATSGKKDSMTSDTMGGANSSSAAVAAPADAVATDKVDITNYMFGPKDIKVKVGTTVTWTNNDSVRHNVAGDDNELPEGKLIAKGETYSYTFMKAGVFTYHCEPHPYMKASVTVE